MTFKYYTLTGILLFILTGMACSQIKLPMFDVELKVHQNLIPGVGENDDDVEFVETTNIYGGAHIQFNQYVALGGFYSRSFRGIGKVRYDNNNSSVENEVLLLQKGLDVRLSTSRAKRWRHFLVLSYTVNEIVQNNQSFRMADKFNSVGVGYGIMRRLSNNLYLNVIELGIKMGTDPEEPVWFAQIGGLIEAKMGLTYNIGKRK